MAILGTGIIGPQGHMDNELDTIEEKEKRIQRADTRTTSTKNYHDKYTKLL